MFKWTQDKIDILKEFYGKISLNELKEKLQYFPNSNLIESKASDLGIRMRIKWYPEMDDVLYDYYPSGNWDMIFKLLPEIKTKHQIAARVRFLKIKSNCFWNNEEIKLLKEKYPYYSNDYLSRNIFPHKKPADIRNYANQLGLKKDNLKKNKFYDKDEMLLQLIDLSKQLNRTPNIKDLKENNLPSETSYRRYFGSYRNACKLCDLDITTTIFGRRISLIDKNSNPCLSVGEIDISNFLIDNNIDFIKEFRYSKLYNKADFGMRKCDWFLPNTKTFVEYFGMVSNKVYAERMNIKIQLCIKHDVKLISIYDSDLKNLKNIFSKFI